jgi:hypothetical protein
MPAPPQNSRPLPPWIATSSDAATPAPEVEVWARLTAALPAPPARVALFGDVGGGTARMLAAGGWRPGAGDAPDADRAPTGSGDVDEGRASDTGDDASPCDAVLLVAPEGTGGAPPLPERLARARRRLADGGRLLIVSELRRPADRDAGLLPVADEVAAALAEAGFLLRRRAPLVPGAAAAADPVCAWELIVATRDPYVIRSGRPEDESAIGALFRDCFHVDRDLPHWRWEYRQGPYGPAPASVGVAADGRLVSHYAGYPVRFVRDLGDGPPRTLLAYQIGDTMTAPAVRKVGRGPTSLLARTVAHFYARHCAGRVGFNYGVNTGNIQRFSVLFAGLRVSEPVPFRLRTLAGAPLPPPGLAASRWTGFRVERVTAFDERWDALFTRVRRAYGLLVERDARYLRWRYGERPGVEYFTHAVFRRRRLVGWSVFRQQGERLVWGDGLFDPDAPRAARLLLARVVAAPEHRGARTIEGWFPDRPAWWGRILDELGFERRPEPQELSLAYVPWEFDPGAALGAHLYYTKGDTDLF